MSHGDRTATPSIRRRAIAALTRRFGAERLPLIEDAVQEALARALARGDEEAASAGWIVRVAHNALLDTMRAERRLVLVDEPLALESAPEVRVVDDELCLVFLCCHPTLSRASQVALTLRIAYGFETVQIARAFLSDERTIAQRIVRAKQRLRDEKVAFALPEPDELPSRVDAILDVLYQVFTEGHAATLDESGVEEALCAESLRIVRGLSEARALTTPAVEALRALFCFHVARAAARRGDDGGLLLLAEQDRTQWDPELTAEGFTWLAQSSRGSFVSRFHVEAGIAACHAAARTWAETDWERILFLYDELRAITPSPVVDVNRAFALAMCRGARAGLEALDEIPERELLARYPYALAVRAELYLSLGETERAAQHLARALEHQPSAAERALMRRKLASLAG